MPAGTPIGNGKGVPAEALSGLDRGAPLAAGLAGELVLIASSALAASETAGGAWTSTSTRSAVGALEAHAPIATPAPSAAQRAQPSRST